MTRLPCRPPAGRPARRPGTIDATDRRLIAAAGAIPGWTSTDLAATVGLTRSAVCIRLGRMMAEGTWPHRRFPPAPSPRLAPVATIPAGAFAEIERYAPIARRMARAAARQMPWLDGDTVESDALYRLTIAMARRREGPGTAPAGPYAIGAVRHAIRDSVRTAAGSWGARARVLARVRVLAAAWGRMGRTG